MLHLKNSKKLELSLSLSTVMDIFSKDNTLTFNTDKIFIIKVNSALARLKIKSIHSQTHIRTQSYFYDKYFSMLCLKS